MRIIAGFLRALWEFSRNSWVSIFLDLRPRSGASAITLFLFLLFFIIGGILMLLGFDLDEVDRWLDARGGLIEGAGAILFRLVCAAFLLVSVLICALGLWTKIFDEPGKRKTRKKQKDEDSFGWGAILVFAVIGYFSWFGVVG